jgi:glutamate dehydrogenase
VDGHWQAVARATLREEAYALQRRLCASALAKAHCGDLGPALEHWLAARGREMESLRRTVEEMRGLGQPDFATLSVALQAVRRLAES